jgi:hypothetical protein
MTNAEGSDAATGNWADEMEDMPIAREPSLDARIENTSS